MKKALLTAKFFVIQAKQGDKLIKLLFRKAGKIQPIPSSIIQNKTFLNQPCRIFIGYQIFI